MNKVQANIGDIIRADQWSGVGAPLAAGDTPIGLYPGAMFRIIMGLGVSIAINVKVTGQPQFVRGGYQTHWRSRVKIEFIQDSGDPSAFAGGWLSHNI